MCISIIDEWVGEGGHALPGLVGQLGGAPGWQFYAASQPSPPRETPFCDLSPAPVYSFPTMNKMKGRVRFTCFLSVHWSGTVRSQKYRGSGHISSGNHPSI